MSEEKKQKLKEYHYDIIKSAFHKNKKPININEVDIEEIVLCHKHHMAKIHLSTVLDVGTKVMLFHHHYAKPFLMNL